MKFEELESKANFPEIQAEMLAFWKDNKIFEKSLENKENGEVVFYDGPPFPTGKPHHGTVLVSFIKDMIARYWTMRGYSVPRVWGWDCHGLPIENQAEVLLGIEDKNLIEKEYGIDKFNDCCYDIVSSNNEAWKTYVEQMARWVDYDGAYKTMNVDFMESVMWAFKQCYDKGYIYRDYRVTPYCMHCETSLSISDTRESDSTRPRQDKWVIVKFKTVMELDGKPVYMLAWTTTPWTLPSNMALAVGLTLDYAFVDVGTEIYIACENTLSKYKKIFGAEPVILKRCNGAEFVGNTYKPLFPYFENLKSEGAFRVIAADFVDSEDGVGVVHIAPAFGEDDYWACKKNNIPLVNPVDSKGYFTEEITDFYSVDNDKNVIDMNPAIIRYLYAKEKGVADGTIEHNYPHCWRCKRPLIYKAMDAWYFSLDKTRDRLIELNEEVNWVPETVKHGRFGKWLSNARDWNISRNRYWSTPMPIWICDDCGEIVVLGSIDEIYQKSGVRLNNLHRQYMDQVTFQCDQCGGTMHRIPEVLDCWFESGAVPFAQKHYPFENKEWFESHFPSDYIVEYTGQIRCWFYYLHVLAGALFDKPAFQNCVVHGTILAKDGKKLSKSSKNYTDPMELMQKYGTDAFRLYLYQSSAMLIGDLLFDDTGLQDALQQIIVPFWNSCNFFISYANIDGFHPEACIEPDTTNSLDLWILAQLYETEQAITENMNQYLVNHYVDNLQILIEGLTNWYIRRSRRRFWSTEESEDKKNAYQTLYYVLVNSCKLFAPVAPIIAEKIYKNLTGELSVHLADWLKIPQKYQNDELLGKIELVQNIINLARSIRNKNRIKNRQPLNTVMIAISDNRISIIDEELSSIIADELNVKRVEMIKNVSDIVSIKYAPNFNEIKAKYPEQIPQIVKAVKNGQFEIVDHRVVISINDKNEMFDESILLVTYEAREGLHVVSDKGIVVSLDLTITEALKREGIAREIVRNIQDARKQIGCEIMDHIKINLKGEYPEEWLTYICDETLSSSEKFDDPMMTLSVQCDDITIEVGIKA